MVTVRGSEKSVEARLRAGRLACWCGGTLRPWGHARPRRVMTFAGLAEVVPRRGICRGGCGRSHVLLPAWLLSRRKYAAVVIFAALALRAGGLKTAAVASRLFPVTEDEDVAVIDCEDVRAWFGPAGWVLAGPWCACWRGGGQSVVISVTAARALCSSTMFLRLAQAATRAWVAMLLTARGRPRAASWMRVTASSLNSGSERPASLRWWVMYPAVCSVVMAGMA